jgi:hypothetical protein
MAGVSFIRIEIFTFLLKQFKDLLPRFGVLAVQLVLKPAVIEL